MEPHITFHRIGAGPGRRAELATVPWQKSDQPLSAGMSPTGRQYYASANGRIVAGIWACTAGNVEITDNPTEEICFIIRGTVKIMDVRGRSEIFGPGECLVLPRGFNGLWSQSDDFAKFHVVVEEA
jgi:uncharacterized cupin superfamily protein